MQMSPGIDDFHLEDDVVEIEAKLNLLRAIKAPFLNLSHKSRRLKGLRMYSTHSILMLWCKIGNEPNKNELSIPNVAVQNQ